MNVRRDAAGTVFVEFLLAFPILFVLFLGIVQLCLIASASLIVRHSAVRAARAAALVLDDEPRRHGGGCRGALATAPAESGGGPLLVADELRSGTIVAAALRPLLAVGPSASAMREWLGGPVADVASGALGSGAQRLAAAEIYNRHGVRVSLPGSARRDGAVQFQAGESVRLRVEYEYVCSVPLARALICRRPRSRRGAPGLGILAGQHGRVYRLRGEASAAVHWAPYLYRSELAGDGC